MIAFFIILGVVGVISLLVGLNMDYRWDGLDFFLGIAGMVMVFAGFFGAVITVSIESDKNYCLKTLPQVSQKETKWLDGECYVKANDGKFVPQTWIEKGYNDK